MKYFNDLKKESIRKILETWQSKNKIIKPNNVNYSLPGIDEIASTFSLGAYYYYYVFNFDTLTMDYVHHSVKGILGITPEEFTIDKLFSLYHPEDLSRMHEKEKAITEFFFDRITPEEIPLYKVAYLTRFKNTNGGYKKILHQACALNVTKDGKIQQAIGVHTDVSYLNVIIDHKISFIGNNRPSYYKLDPCNLVYEKKETKSLFTKQELLIIQLISEGKSSDEISSLLNLAQHTIKTHRKNILKKSGAINTAQLITNCIREGVI